MPIAEDYQNRVKVEQKQEQHPENEYSNIEQQKMEASKPTSEDYQNRVKVEQKQEQQENEYSNVQQMEANKPTTEYVIAPNHNDTF
jgi:hypothetical protein